VGWVGHVAFSRGITKSYRIFVEKIKNEEICRWDDNIKIEVTETECPCAGLDWRIWFRTGKWWVVFNT
jgi:hypothetical protein